MLSNLLCLTLLTTFLCARSRHEETYPVITVDLQNCSLDSVRSRISILNRTRDSLSAIGAFSTELGQVLDKALAKQLNSRQEEIGETSSHVPRQVPVIVRNSTPLPLEENSLHAECSKKFFSKSPNFLERNQPTFFAPLDHDFPLRTFLRDLPEDNSSYLSLSQEYFLA